MSTSTIAHGSRKVTARFPARYANHFKWGFHNTKMAALAAHENARVGTFDIRAGWTCPAARICLAKVMPDGTLKHGKESTLTCYAARIESTYRNTYNAHLYNETKVMRTIKRFGIDITARMITADIMAARLDIVRIHSSGDMYNADYVRMWIRVAELNPDVRFFGYTKSMPAYMTIAQCGVDNIRFAFSYGSRHDNLIVPGVVVAYIVENDDMESALAARGIPTLCKNDQHADVAAYSADYDYIYNRRESFGLDIH